MFIASWMHRVRELVSGYFLWREAAFWSLFGFLVIANVVFEYHGTRPGQHPRTGGIAGCWRSERGTFATIAVLWSIRLYYATMSSWLYAMTRWTRGPAQ